MIFLDGQHIREQSFYVTCNLCSEKLAGLQTVVTVVCTQRHRFDVDMFPIFSSVSWTGQGFCRDLDPGCWSE